MPSDDLAARLRALRRSDAASKVAKPAHLATPQPVAAPAGVRSKVVKRDDIDELIARTRDEVDVAREQGELSDGDEDDHGGLPSSAAPLNLDVAAEGKAFRSLAQEASSDAAAALREHRKTIERGQEKVASPPSGADKRLTLEAKARPVLVRPTSSYQGEADDAQEDDDIASELAEAMGDTGGKSTAATSGNPISSPSPKPLQQGATAAGSQPQPPTDEAAAVSARPKAETLAAAKEGDDGIEAEVQDLLARFTALRPSASRSVSAASTNSTVPQPAAQPADDADGDEVDDRFAGLNLPSAPSTALQSLPHPAAEPPTPAHPTLGPSHSDISSDRDLSPFHRLVSKEFNVSSRLSNPTTSSDEPLLPSAPRSGLDEEDGDEIFCSLCSEDASLTCFCPGDEYEGCAGDAYCSGCWVEAHSGMGREELREHRTKDVATWRSGRRGGGKGNGQPRRRAMAA